MQNRRSAAVGLEALGRHLAEAVPSLLNALQDDDEAVRRLATTVICSEPNDSDSGIMPFTIARLPRSRLPSAKTVLTESK